MMPEAKVIADSISPEGVRLTTLELTMHRFVLAEFNTHRVFSRNSASSRAIPINKSMDKVIHDPAWPLLWNSEKPGMQGGQSLTGQSLFEAQFLFEDIRDYTVNKIRDYLSTCEHGELDKLHKAYLNRLLEPFMAHKVIVSSTEWENFFEQRISPLALPEFNAVAVCIKNALEDSTPQKLDVGNWHLPYIEADLFTNDFSDNNLIRISAARCARVSYETHDGVRNTKKDLELADKLMTANPMHYSPFEHMARVVDCEIPTSNFSYPWLQARTLLQEGLDLQ